MRLNGFIVNHLKQFAVLHFGIIQLCLQMCDCMLLFVLEFGLVIWNQQKHSGYQPNNSEL